MYKNVSCRLTFQSRIKIPKMSEYFSILIYLLCFLKAKFMKQSQRCFIPRLHQTVNSSKIKIAFCPRHDCLTDLICITLPLVFRCNDITHLNNFFFSQHAIVDSGSSYQPVGTFFLCQPHAISIVAIHIFNICSLVLLLFLPFVKGLDIIGDSLLII